MAGEDLLCYLNGDVTLLSPLVQIQQVSSEARGWLKNSIWSEVEMDNEEGQKGESVSEKGCECAIMCVRHITWVFVSVCESYTIV